MTQASNGALITTTTPPVRSGRRSGPGPAASQLIGGGSFGSISADSGPFRLAPGPARALPADRLAGSLAVRAPGPTARPTLAFLQLFLGAANATFPSLLLLGVLNPADELVAGQRRDVHPRLERGGVGDQHDPQIRRELVDHSTGQSLCRHGVRVAAGTGRLLSARPGVVQKVDADQAGFICSKCLAATCSALCLEG